MLSARIDMILPICGGSMIPVTVTVSPSGSTPVVGIGIVISDPEVTRASTSSGFGGLSSAGSTGLIVTNVWPVVRAPLCDSTT